MFEELKTFIAVVELNNFTKAGELLNLSQPSVSTHIKNLENYFGVTLINRSIKQKTIFITESGHTLYRHAKEIINLLNFTYMDVRNISNNVRGLLKVGASLTIGEYLLPNFLSYFSNKYPDIEIETFIENTSSIVSKVNDLSLDIGLIEGFTACPNITQEYFLEDTMVLAFSKEYKLSKETLDFNKLCNEKWIAREAGSGTREYFDMFLYNNKIRPKNIMVFGSNYSVKEAVRNNLGLTIISSFVTSPAVKNNELSVIKLDKCYNRHFSYILPKNITYSKASKVFIDELKKFNFNK